MAYIAIPDKRFLSLAATLQRTSRYSSVSKQDGPEQEDLLTRTILALSEKSPPLVLFAQTDSNMETSSAFHHLFARTHSTPMYVHLAEWPLPEEHFRQADIVLLGGRSNAGVLQNPDVINFLNQHLRSNTPIIAWGDAAGYLFEYAWTDQPDGTRKLSRGLGCIQGFGNPHCSEEIAGNKSRPYCELDFVLTATEIDPHRPAYGLLDSTIFMPPRQRGIHELPTRIFLASLRDPTQEIRGIKITINGHNRTAILEPPPPNPTLQRTVPADITSTRPLHKAGNRPNQVVAFGGNLPEYSSRAGQQLVAYLHHSSGLERPNVLLLATAAGDKTSLVADFFNGWRSCADVEQLDLFGPRSEYFVDKNGVLSEPFFNADIIILPGGRMDIAIASWERLGINKMIRKCLQDGKMFVTSSAGTHALFEVCSSGEVNSFIQHGLGHFRGSVATHYNNPTRKHLYHQRVRNRELPEGLGIDEGAGIHFIDGVAKRIVNLDGRSSASIVTLSEVDTRVDEFRLSALDLRDTQPTETAQMFPLNWAEAEILTHLTSPRRGRSAKGNVLGSCGDIH